MFKHILLPVDGSELSLHAVKLGIELAQTCHAGLSALHVVVPYHTMANMVELLVVSEATHTREAFENAERYLLEVQALANAEGVECRAAAMSSTTILTQRSWRRYTPKAAIWWSWRHTVGAA